MKDGKRKKKDIEGLLATAGGGWTKEEGSFSVSLRLERKWGKEKREIKCTAGKGNRRRKKDAIGEKIYMRPSSRGKLTSSRPMMPC